MTEWADYGPETRIPADLGVYRLGKFAVRLPGGGCRVHARVIGVYAAGHFGTPRGSVRCFRVRRRHTGEFSGVA